MKKHKFENFPEAYPHMEKRMRNAFKLPDSFCYRLPPKKISEEQLQESAVRCSVFKSAGEIFSSVDGQIKILLVTYPVYGRGQLIYRRTLTDLLQKMPHVDFFVFAEYPPGTAEVPLRYRHVPTHLRQMKRKYETNGRRIHFIRSGFPHFTCWVRDPFLTGATSADHEGNARGVCIEPVGFLREDQDADGSLSSDAQIADEIVRQNQHQFELVNAPLVFHGGNVLAGDDFILVGKDYYSREKNARKLMARRKLFIPGMSLSTEMQAIRADFREWLSPNQKREILVLGEKRPKNFMQPDAELPPEDVFGRFPVGKSQPFFHLDLFLTLAGRNRETGAYRILVARIENASDIHTEAIQDSIVDPWNAWIGNIAGELERNGFEISYLPMPLMYGVHRDYGRRDWFVLSYNNCLVEISRSGKKVWMPTYGTPMEDHDAFILNTDRLAEFDQKAEQCFRSLGFEVHPLMNYLPHMLYGGAVHCLTNCLWREP